MDVGAIFALVFCLLCFFLVDWYRQRNDKAACCPKCGIRWGSDSRTGEKKSLKEDKPWSPMEKYTELQCPHCEHKWWVKKSYLASRKL